MTTLRKIPGAGSEPEIAPAYRARHGSTGQPGIAASSFSTIVWLIVTVVIVGFLVGIIAGG